MSVLDLSLVKGPYGKGPRGPATINGWHFDIDPSSVALPIRAKVQKYRTVGGFVVQVYGTTWGDLTVSGQFGTGGWRSQLAFLDNMMTIARQQSLQRPATYAGQNFTPGKPFRFTFPLLGWDFPECYLKNYTSPDGPLAVHMENDNINPKWTLTIFVVTDRNSLEVVTKTAYLQRLAPGLGVMWDTTTESYQGYSDDQYNAPLTSADVQAYVNSPTGGGANDVISALPSSLSGPDTTPPTSGSTSAGNLNINNASDFAKALLTALGIAITTVNTNLIRAWCCQEGMWNQALLNDGSYPGGWAAWGAPAMNNPLNIGGWNGQGANGTKDTYDGFPVTWLNNGSTGVTFSFGGNWSNGVTATAYALENENASWPAIVTALSESNPTAFFAAVEAWNPGKSDYASEVESLYTSGSYVSANY
jgi:hypothetical protein